MTKVLLLVIGNNFLCLEKLIEGLVIQGSKKEVKKVVSLCKNGDISIHFKQNFKLSSSVDKITCFRLSLAFDHSPLCGLKVNG